jgi:hypothetical protein
MFGTSILDKHFFYGDNISISVIPEGNIAVQKVKGTLFDGKGQVIKNNIPFNLQNGEWTNKMHLPTERR